MKSPLYSKLFFSALVALLINSTLRLTDPLRQVEPQNLPHAHSWAWWAAQDFLDELQPPQVVLIGSSLMMNPVWANEANFQNKDVDIALDRRVMYLDAAIKHRLRHTAVSCFNLALPGAMLSDDYMVVRSLLIDKNKPKIVVFGLSPRDLVDNGFRCAASSNHYKYFSKFVNTDDLTEVAMPHFWQRISYLIGRTIYLQGKKPEAQYIAAKSFEFLATRILGKQATSDLASPKVAQSRLAIYESEVEKGVWIAHPRDFDYYHETEYEKLKERYGKSNVEGCENQRKWFEMCLALCKEAEIQPIIVNMPVTQANIDVFAPGVYQTCVNQMATEARKFNCPFIDLQKTQAFVRSDFTDMCHMDASGGKKTLDFIADEIAGEPSCVASLSRDNFQIADTSDHTK